LGEAVVIANAMSANGRFPALWTVKKLPSAFVIRDVTGQSLVCVYYEEELDRRSATKQLTKDEAWLIVGNIASLPELLRPSTS
jgi:hypothetical protein